MRNRLVVAGSNKNGKNTDTTNALNNTENATSQSGRKKSLLFTLFCTGVCLAIALQVFGLFFGLLEQHKNDNTHEHDHDHHRQHGGSEITTTNVRHLVRNYNATATVAYAVSLIKCGDKQSNDAGLVDAALVMRHSIHKISIRNPESKSRYDYKMYAIVHKQAEPCSRILKNAGFHIILIEESPVKPSEIRGEYLRNNIQKEWCCGSDEFIKLYAYTLPEPVVVHVDIDFVFLKPMDILFDAILYPKDSPEGKRSRSQMPLERPHHDVMPDKIDAFITRDWPQVIPGRKSLYQAGFLVARRNPEVVEEAISIIREGNYKEGYDLHNGWGAAGYGGFVGAMAMQGLMAYYYDVVRPNTAVELNQCRFNHMGMDVRYRHPPNFISRKVKKIGKCRNFRNECEDCMTTNVSLIFNVHYTECRKPWNCISEGHGGGRVPFGKPGSAIDTNAGNLDHCLELLKSWHELRLDLENAAFALTGDKTILNGILGSYKREVFHGHCSGEGGMNYTSIQGRHETFERLQDLYI